MRVKHSPLWATLAAILILAIGAGQAHAQERQRLIGICSDAAQRYFGDYEARTNMRWSEPRVDGTRTVGGDIFLETRKAYVMCGFPPRGRGSQLTEFFVEGRDRLAALRRKGSRPSGGGGSRLVSVTGVPYGDVLNMRNGPGTNYRIVGVVSNGDWVRLLGCEGGGRSRWCQIEKTQSEMRAGGWVNARYLALNEAGQLPREPAARRAGRAIGAAVAAGLAAAVAGASRDRARPDRCRQVRRSCARLHDRGSRRYGRCVRRRHC